MLPSQTALSTNCPLAQPPQHNSSIFFCVADARLVSVLGTRLCLLGAWARLDRSGDAAAVQSAGGWHVIVSQMMMIKSLREVTVITRWEPDLSSWLAFACPSYIAPRALAGKWFCLALGCIFAFRRLLWLLLHLPALHGCSSSWLASTSTLGLRFLGIALVDSPGCTAATSSRLRHALKDESFLMVMVCFPDWDSLL